MARRKQDENLRPRELTNEEAVRIGRKGGVASGVARRERKALLQTFETFLSMTLKDGEYADIEKVKSIAGIKGQNITVQEGIVYAQMARALKGDPKSFAIITGYIQAEEEKSKETGAGVQIVDDFTD